MKGNDRLLFVYSNQQGCRPEWRTLWSCNFNWNSDSNLSFMFHCGLDNANSELLYIFKIKKIQMTNFYICNRSLCKETKMAFGLAPAALPPGRSVVTLRYRVVLGTADNGQRTMEYPGVKAARILRVTAWRGWGPFYTQVRTVRANRVITTSQKFLRTALVISIGAIGHFAPLPVIKTLPRLPKDSAKFLWPYRLWLWTDKPRRKSNGNSRVNRKGGPGSSGRRAEPIDYIR